MLRRSMLVSCNQLPGQVSPNRLLVRVYGPRHLPVHNLLLLLVFINVCKCWQDLEDRRS